MYHPVDGYSYTALFFIEKWYKYLKNACTRTVASALVAKNGGSGLRVSNGSKAYIYNP